MHTKLMLLPLPGVNVADFILDLAMGEVPGSNGLSGHDAIRAVYRSYEQFAITADDGFHDSTQLQELRLVEAKEQEAGGDAAGAKSAKSSTYSGVSGMFQLMKSHGMAAGSDADAEAPVVVASSGAALSATTGLGRAAERVTNWGGLRNRGGASYATQLLVLLSRCIKVSHGMNMMSVTRHALTMAALVLSAPESSPDQIAGCVP